MIITVRKVSDKVERERLIVTAVIKEELVERLVSLDPMEHADIFVAVIVPTQTGIREVYDLRQMNRVSKGNVVAIANDLRIW